MAWDDVNVGNMLIPDKVVEARGTEMQYFQRMKVYDIVPREMILQVGGKLIDTRWIDTNKADELDPEYRSRLVGREFRTEKDDSLYASTPPLESLRVILSWASTVKQDNGVHENEVMINDVRRAYFYAKASRNMFI